MLKNYYFENKKSRYYFLIINLAISSIITQFVLLREFINLFNGNELIISVFLSNWFLIYGFGAFIGKWFKLLKKPEKLLSLFTILLILYPPFIIIIMRIMNKLFFTPGFEAGFIYSFIFSFIILFFYCIIQGSLFTLFCQIINDKSENKINISKIYLFDNTGNLIGGFIYSFIMIFIFSNTQNILIPSILCIFSLIFLFSKRKILSLLFYIISITTFILLIFFMNKFDFKTIGLNFQGQNILNIKETKIGRLVVTSTDNQINFYNNKQLLFNTNDHIKNEESVHFAACQINKIKEILLIGGDISGITDELLKYSPELITYVTTDINIIKLVKKYSSLKENKIINIIINDGKNYLINSNKKYDLIIIDMPPPDSLQLNRFYTVEFFKIIKSKLSQNGVFSFSIPSNENYLNKYQISLISSLYNSLKQIFKDTIIIPGDTKFFISSDNYLKYDIVSLLEEKKITTQYVNKSYMTSRLSERNIKNIMNQIILKTPANYDFKPYAFFSSLKGWTYHFGKIDNIFYFILVTLFVLILINQNRLSFIILTTGFTGSVLEILILLISQIIIGYIYFAIGILITFFMAGLAIGTLYARKTQNNLKQKLLFSEIFLICFSIFFLINIKLHNIVYSNILLIIFFVSFILIAGILVGFQFSICTRLNSENITKTSSRLYSADFFGSYFGILLTGILFIPVFGFINVILMTICIKIISLFFSFSIKIN